MGYRNIEQVYDVAVIGAGFSGIGMGIQLSRNSIHNFVILERNDDVGGVWEQNNYPDCGCDVPSPLYQLSFHKNPNWSQQCASRDEIKQYLKNAAKKHSFTDKIQLNTCVQSTEFDTQSGTWTISTNSGSQLRSRAIVVAIGINGKPKKPKFKGIENFQGDMWHTSEWRHDVSLKAKNVAMIGNGASNAQVLQHVVNNAANVTLFTRTPQWVLPKAQQDNSKLMILLKKYVPGLITLEYNLFYWVSELLLLPILQVGNMEQFFKGVSQKFISNVVTDKHLQEHVMPQYAFGCRRPLFNSQYLQIIQNQQVKLAPSYVQEITENSVIDNEGQEHKADTIILGTGFITGGPDYFPFEVKGLNGKTLKDEWNSKGRLQAYYGGLVSGFPNMYMIYGPNAASGYTSNTVFIEISIRFALIYSKLILNLTKKGYNNSYIDVNPEAQEKYNEMIQQRSATGIWPNSLGQCASQYNNEKGENTRLFPGASFEYSKLLNSGVDRQDCSVYPAEVANSKTWLQGSKGRKGQSYQQMFDQSWKALGPRGVLLAGRIISWFTKTSV